MMVSLPAEPTTPSTPEMKSPGAGVIVIVPLALNTIVVRARIGAEVDDVTEQPAGERAVLAGRLVLETARRVVRAVALDLIHTRAADEHVAALGALQVSRPRDHRRG